MTTNSPSKKTNPDLSFEETNPKFSFEETNPKQIHNNPPRAGSHRFRPFYFK